MPKIVISECKQYFLESCMVAEIAEKNKIMVRMTNAERQKKYREKQKQLKGKDYLKKESQRVKKYYVPTDELSTRKLAKRREKIRMCMKKNRDAMKSLKNAVNSSNITTSLSSVDTGPCDSTVLDTELGNDPGTSRMTVKMNFQVPIHNRKRNTKLLNANKKLKLMNEKVVDLQRRNSCLRKRLERLKKKEIKSPYTNKIDSNNLTPKSKTKKEIEELNVTPKSKKKIFKRLHFQNCLESEMKMTSSNKQNSKAWIRVLGGKIIQKYKMSRNLATYTGIDRRRYRRIKNGMKERIERLSEKRMELRRRITDFMERDDVSTCLPGRKDSKKVGKVQKQKRVLNDYLYNLHLKFKAENDSSKVSLTTFSRLRPKHVQLVQFCNRKTCLCQRHQNMALKCKSLRDMKVISTDSPDVLTEKMNDLDILKSIENIPNNTITFPEWQRITVVKKGREFKRMQIVNVEESKGDFVKRMQKDLTDFRQHIIRVKAQYEQSRLLKEELPADHAICHMDFAENYSCSFADEIQTAYFDKSTVTLHPVVVYFRHHETGEVKHKSNVIISNETAHTATTVFAIMKKVVNVVKEILPSCKMIHYMTYSPTSQYRNRQIFSIVANHDKIFSGIQAAWLYFEAGHGKGPCDGVGGTAKRLADMAVRRHKAVIQNAEDFFKWGKGQENSNLKYIFVDKSECDEAKLEISNMTVKPLKGTLQIHAVVPLGDGKIATRETSCYCEKCFSGGKFDIGCSELKRQVLISENSASDIPEEYANVVEMQRPESPDPMNHDNNSHNQAYAVNTYVAAMYNNRWYMAKILKYDETDGEYFISFMIEGKKSFKWPSTADTVWIQEEEILCSVRDPVKTGKTRNIYKFDEEDIDRVMGFFK